MANSVDINQIVLDTSQDVHDTLLQAQEAIKSLQIATTTINTQALKIGALLDALTADADAAKLTIQDADGVVKTIKLPWLFRK